MKKSFNHKINGYVYEIFAGDYYVSGEKRIVLTTLLGSCISVCLRDEKTGLAGINHFMLPQKSGGRKASPAADARYGSDSMEMLLNRMEDLGAEKSNLKAKIFGGGQVIVTNLNNVARANIDFVFNYLKKKNIPVISSDVGGEKGRKIYFSPDCFTVYVKRIHYDRTLESALLQEKLFLEWMYRQHNRKCDLMLSKLRR